MHHPGHELLGLLVYSYATRVFSSRQIERTTHEKVAVRVICSETHPDHGLGLRDSTHLVAEADVEGGDREEV